MPRTRQFDREAVLASAMRAFWRNGYEATSVQDLVEATGINRASMYGAFGDKRGLFLAALGYYLAEVSAARFARLEHAPSPLAGLRAFFDDVIEFSLGEGRSLGCLLTNSVVELAPRDPEVAAVLAGTLRGAERAFLAVLRRAVRDGELPPDTDVRPLARFLVGVMQGLRVLARADPGRVALRDVVEVALGAVRRAA